MFKHCTILYGTCEDSDNGVNFQSEYWRKLIPSDFAAASVTSDMSRGYRIVLLRLVHAGKSQDIPKVGLSTCNGTMLTCSEDGTEPWMPQLHALDCYCILCALVQTRTLARPMMVA